MDHIVGDLECCFKDARLYFVGAGEPLKSFELMWGEVGENRVEFCKDFSAASEGWWRVAARKVWLGRWVHSTVQLRGVEPGQV